VSLTVTELIVTFVSDIFRNVAIDARATASTDVAFREAEKEIATSA
jgi:hypothetical protein